MDRRTVLTKTAKGLMEVTGKTSLLARDLRAALAYVDGKATIGDLQQRLDKLTEPKLYDVLGKLVREGFVREFVSAPASISPPSQVPIVHEHVELDLSAFMPKRNRAQDAAEQSAEAEEVARQVLAAARAREETEARERAEAQAKRDAEERGRREAEERARKEAEAKAKREAEEKAKREAEERARKEAEAKARREAEEKAKREAEERVRKEAEAKAKREAEEKAKRDAEERTRKEAEAKAKREAEERARKEAAAKAKHEAEEKAKREAEERARKEAEAKARREAEEKAKREAEERARKEAEAKAKREAEEKAKREAEERTRKEAEAKARREAEEKAKREAEERVRKEAEAKAKREAEEKAKRDAEERARKEAEVKAKREAEEKAKRQAEERARKEAEAKARREAEEKAKRETEERARKEAEAKAKREAEEKAKREAEELARKEAEAKAKREAEEKARREAEERARKEAEANAKREAEEKAKREVEERARKEADAKAMRDAEEKAKQEAEESVRRELEANARREAEDKARRESDERAGKEREEQARKDAEREARDEERARAKAEAEAAARERKEERAREKAEAEERSAAREHDHERDAAEVAARLEKIRQGKRGGVGKWVAGGAVAVIAVAAATLQFMSLDTGFYERLASKQLGQPVKIGAASFSLFPTPGMKFRDVKIGADGLLKVAEVNAVPELASMFGETRAFKDVELVNAAIVPAAMSAALWGKMQGGALSVERVRLRGLKLVVPQASLPALDGEGSLARDGKLKHLSLRGADKAFRLELQPQSNQMLVELAAADAQAVFGLPFKLEQFNAKGVATASELVFREFDGRAFDGLLKGKATLRWGDKWTLTGNVEALQLDVAKLAPALTGRMRGDATFTLESASLDQLFGSSRIEGRFAVEKGQVSGIDLVRSIQSGKMSVGATLYNEFSGEFSVDGERASLRGVRLTTGMLTVGGNIEAHGAKTVAGRLAAEMKAPAGVLRSNFTLAGSPSQLQLKR